jgi:protein gp37
VTNNSSIEWTDVTWNPVSGCSKVSQGCKHCYAERIFPRPYPGRKFTDVRTHPDRLLQPVGMAKGKRIFVNSMSDLFHEDIPLSFIAAVFGIMAVTPRHTYQVLTKRPKNALSFFEWMSKYPRDVMHEAVKGAIGYHHPKRPAVNVTTWPLPNVWLGVSVEDQATADERIPLLLQAPARVRFLSCEPLLSGIDLTAYLNCHTDKTGVDWVIAGGESGPKARPMHPAWARGLRDQCLLAGVPFLFKQWGEWGPQCLYPGLATIRANLWVDGATVWKVGKKKSGRELDGRTWDQFPEVA